MSDLSAQIQEKNPSDVPMKDCHYWHWLEGMEVKTAHSVYTKLQYLKEEFNFVKGEDRVSTETLHVLKNIEEFWFYVSIRPTLK